MPLLPGPTRHELLSALEFPALAAPFLLVFIRYRMLTWDVASANRRDRVDYSPEAWQLSGYLTLLFVLVAYPLSLSKYDDWLWQAHPYLTLTFIAFWASLCGWIWVRHFQHQSRSDEKLRAELEAISHGSTPTQPVGTPYWLQVWGMGNALVLSALLIAIVVVLSSLR